MILIFSIFNFFAFVIIVTTDETSGLFKIVDSRLHSTFVCEKIAATVATRNEEYLLGDSVASIAPYVGEVIIIDHGSTDSTPQIIKNLTKRFSNVHGYRVEYSTPYSEVFNIGYMFSTKPWILKWDADFFFYPNAQKKLCSLINRCERKGIKVIWYGLPRVDGDLDHVYPWSTQGDNAEQRLVQRGYFLKRQTIKYSDDNIVTFPKTKAIMSKDVYLVHAGSFKFAERLYYRSSHTPYSIYKNIQISKKLKLLSFWEWEFERLTKRKNYSNVDVEAFRKERIKKFCDGNVMPFAEFNVKKFGKIPEYMRHLKIVNDFKLKYIKTDDKGRKLYRRIMPGCPDN